MEIVEATFTCDHCQKTHGSKSALHGNMGMLRDYRCGLCDVTCMGRKAFKKHNKEEHEQDSPKQNGGEQDELEN